MISPLLIFIAGAFAGGILSGLVVEFYGRSQSKNQLKAARKELVVEHEHNLQDVRDRLTELLNGQQSLLAVREDELKAVRSQLGKVTEQLKGQKSTLALREDELQAVRSQLGQINTQRSQLKEKNAALSENISQIRQQLSYQQQENKEIQAEYGATLTSQKNRYDELKREHERAEIKHEEKVSRLSDQHREMLETHNAQITDQDALLKAENTALQTRNKALAAENKSLESNIKELYLQHSQEIASLTQQFASHKEVTETTSTETTSKEPRTDIDFGMLAHSLFPGIKLLRDSADEISRHPKEAGEILCRLLAFENNNFEYSKKVQGTGGYWSECRAPHLNMIRLYYRKGKRSPSGKCEVLISYKKDRKTQEKDIAWLQNQAKKR